MPNGSMEAAFASAGYVPPMTDAIRLQRIAVKIVRAPPEIPEFPDDFNAGSGRLVNVAMAARAAYGNWDEARHALIAAVRNDPDLLWELFKNFRNQAIHAALTDAAERVRRQDRDKAPLRSVPGGRGQEHSDYQDAVAPSAQPSGGGGQRNHENHRAPALAPRASFASARALHADAGRAAVASIARLSLLDTFKINGQSIGDATADEAMAWACSRERDIRFIRALTANLPQDQPIRKYRTDPDEVQAIYDHATREVRDVA